MRTSRRESLRSLDKASICPVLFQYLGLSFQVLILQPRQKPGRPSFLIQRPNSNPSFKLEIPFSIFKMSNAPRPIQSVSNTELYNRWAKVSNPFLQLKTAVEKRTTFNIFPGLRHRWQHPPSHRRCPPPSSPNPTLHPSLKRLYLTPNHHRARRWHRAKHSQTPIPLTLDSNLPH